MYIKTAIEAAKLGGKILKDNLNSKKSKAITSKQQFNFVTQVDSNK